MLKKTKAWFSTIKKRVSYMNNVTINGQVIDGDLVAGKTINITSEGDKIIINGRTVLTTQEKNITVVVNGDVRGRR